LYEKAIKGFPGAQKQRSDGQTPHPLWELPKGVSLINSGATLVKLNLIFFDDNANRKVGPSGQGMMVAEKDGNPARLVCFSRDCSELIVVPLKFAWQRGRPPLSKQLPWLAGDTWMRCSGNTLYIGQPDTPGIWAVPISEVEAAIDAQKQRLLDQKNQEKQAAEVGRKILLAKYDRNHNGLIDAEEREAALDDPAFIESELDVIDANHNGWLEAKELAWFDANTNKILEPKEQAGIEIAQHLLAQRLLKQFDANGDGLLDRQECNDLFQSSMESSIRSMPGMSGGPVPFPDENHDGLIDMGELESFLKQQTRSGLRSRGMPGMASFNQMRMDANQPGDPRQIFKAAVESYWQNPGGVTNRPPFNNRIPSGAGFVPSRIPQGVTQ
jgi:Ca2+-binding EF-hand superfamily protein